jgi:hypothetical protein
MMFLDAWIENVLTAHLRRNNFPLTTDDGNGLIWHRLEISGGCYVHGNETAVSIKCCHIHEWLGKYWFLKQNSVSWS